MQVKYSNVFVPESVVRSSVYILIDCSVYNSSSVIISALRQIVIVCLEVFGYILMSMFFDDKWTILIEIDLNFVEESAEESVLIITIGIASEY